MKRGKLHKSYTIRAGCWNCIHVTGHEDLQLYCNRKGDEPDGLEVTKDAPDTLYLWQREHAVDAYGFCDKWEIGHG